MKNNQSSFATVGLQLSLIPIIFIVILGFIYYYISSTLNQHKQNYINLEFVGRQRMLQEQHLSSVFLAQLNNPMPERLELARRVLKDTQRALLSGGKTLDRLDQDGLIDVLPVVSPEARRLLAQQESLINQGFKISDQFLALSPDSPEYQPTLLRLLEHENEVQSLGIDIAKEITAAMEQRSEQLIHNQGILSIIVGILAFLVSWLISRRITVPLQSIVETADQIAKGNLRLPALKLNQSREISALGTAFNNMVDNLRNLTQQILEVTGNVHSASAEILASTQQQASSTKEQAATVQEISTTMQEISQSGAEITEKAKQVAASAEATSTASELGVSAIENTNRLMEDIRQQIEEVAVKIVALSERTQAVGDIVHNVNEISEQSNLLALNASIEAASAGEHGSRFAVVAGEMRNLAQRAKESTVQVSSILGEIQRGINSTVMLTEEAVKRSESGKQQAIVTQNTIHQMTQTTIESVHAFQQIIGASSQQQIGFEQVTQGMRDIRQATEQTAIGTSQLEKALGNLNELSIQLRNAVSLYQI